MTDTPLAAVRVVLFEPQDPVNIAATVRAMKNMGLAGLRLVRPVPWERERLEGIAHDTFDVIDRIEQYDTLDAALADCVRVAGFTARRRAGRRTVVDVKGASSALLDWAARGPVAILFGREDSGLPNEALDRAHEVVTIPTTEHSSLNLAQAVLIAAYELHLAAESATRTVGPPKHDAPPAAQEHFERFFADAERALEAIEFFKTRYTEHIMRSVRALAYRAAPDAREIGLMRSVALEVVRAMDRIRRGIGGRPLDPDAGG
jgi:TrmH family RNA methyltransferase